MTPFLKPIAVLLPYKLELAKSKVKDDKYVYYNTYVKYTQHRPPKLVLQLKVVNPFSKEKSVDSNHMYAHFVKNLNLI